jgi:hypothetical protein
MLIRSLNHVAFRFLLVILTSQAKLVPYTNELMLPPGCTTALEPVSSFEVKLSLWLNLKREPSQVLNQIVGKKCAQPAKQIPIFFPYSHHNSTRIMNP